MGLTPGERAKRIVPAKSAAGYGARSRDLPDQSYRPVPLGHRDMLLDTAVVQTTYINLLLYREQPGWSQATQPADSVVALVTSPFGWNSAFGEPFVQKLLRKPLPRMARVRALWAGLIG